MSQSFARVVLHTTFSTKYREWTITPDVEKSLLAYMSKILINLGSEVIEINSVPDHVHIVHTLPRTISIADLLKALKQGSSEFLTDEYPHTHKNFAWQVGYATFSADYRNLKGLIAYVRNQKIHHKVESFVREFTKLMNAFGFQVNPKYQFPDRSD